MAKIARHPNGIDVITFNKKEHSYTDQNGNKYLSTTRLIKGQFPEFKALEMATKCAGKGKYKDMDVDDVLQAWEENRDEAANFGTFIHEYAEYLLTGKAMNIVCESERARLFKKSVSNFIDILLKKYEVISTELIVFDPIWRISGTLDLLLKNKETGKLVIADWKTNKKIEKYNKFSKGNGALNHLYNCNYAHYGLQLNTYKAILHNNEYYDCKDCEMILFHITDKKVKLIEVNDMEKEIFYMLSQGGIL